MQLSHFLTLMKGATGRVSIVSELFGCCWRFSENPSRREYVLYCICTCIYFKKLFVLFSDISIFIAISVDESIFLDFLNFPMINIKSRDLEATPIGGATSKPASDVICLLLLA